MTKTSSAKKKVKPAHQDHVEQEKFTSKPKKIGSEIDDIFAGKKRRNSIQANSNERKNQLRITYSSIIPYSPNSPSTTRCCLMHFSLNNQMYWCQTFLVKE
ncbi:unnamed protein product [Fraxinus pennsylvanica]|uniref:Uncharacterized protein n=1 Tax=Fraxinus pennsylvanica TaxID=56036 RepID=A0AAD2E0D1_9LAMI|nr:unnamed protein product [Fraxinus pennsylvanica]